MGFPAIAAGVSLVGAGIGAYNQINGANQEASALNAGANLGPLNFLLAKAQSDAANKAADYTQLQGQYAAKLGKMQGDNALAGSQAQAEETLRAGRILQSNLQAASAAGGGNASSSDVIKLAGGIGGQSRYSALVNLYNGQVARNESIYQGQLAKYAADQKANALRNEAANYNTAGIQALAQSSLDRSKASLVKSNAMKSAAGTLLGQAGSIGVGYMNAAGENGYNKDLAAFKSLFSA